MIDSELVDVMMRVLSVFITAPKGAPISSNCCRRCSCDESSETSHNQAQETIVSFMEMKEDSFDLEEYGLII